MNREQIISILAESGIENNKALTTALLTAFNEDKRVSLEEEAKKVREEYKDYKKPDEYVALQNEITSLKDANAKTIRANGYKNNKVMDKWVDYVDAQYKKSAEENKDVKFDEWLLSFVKNNPELLEREKTQETPTEAKPVEEEKKDVKEVKSVETKTIGNTQTSTTKPNNTPSSLRDAIAQAYGFDKK